MPIPIPKPTSIGDPATVLQYMSFADAEVLQFTNAHQPSLAETFTRLANVAKKNKAITASNKEREKEIPYKECM